jgi:hypothetical protein
MSDSQLMVRISAPFGLCDAMAEVEHEGGTTIIAIAQGRYEGTVPGRPLRVRLLEELDAAPASAAGADGTGPDGEPDGVPVSVDELFGAGVAVPDGGELRLLVVWGTPCHQTVELKEGRRFGSYEHQLCAELVGLDEHEQPYSIDGMAMPLAKDDRLPVGEHRLRFGEIISLAGDFYGHLDTRAANELAWAWPELTGFVGWLAGRDYRQPSLADAEAGEPHGVLHVIERDKNTTHGVAGELCQLVQDSVRGSYPARRYLALASQNYCHFGSQPSDGSVDDERNTALKLYRAYHARALDEARAAGWDQQALLRAFACDAFGCHFLTDLFASGHMRVPRRELGERYGILVGALRKSHAMHAEDNALGLWCATRGSLGSARRRVWRAYGDGMLRTDEAKPHLAQVREAVRRSALEVFAAARGGTVPETERAEWLIPHPLAAGERPADADVILGGGDPRVPNHYPLYWLLPSGQIAQRVGGHHEATYHYKDGILSSHELQFGQLGQLGQFGQFGQFGRPA